MSHEKPDGKSRGSNPWVTAGIFGALGIEFVSLVFGGFWIGSMLDERFDVAPWATVGMLVLCLVGGGAHVVLITKRFVALEDEASNGSD